jgi:membrane protease YdiL (CAAX protease family)
MPTSADTYWSATKHPWACVLFVLPLLVTYEIGLYVSGMPPEELRNGADAWLRSGLDAIGLSPLYGAPCLLMFVLLVWGLVRREGLPGDALGVWIGMIAESAAYALILMGLSQGMWHVLLRADNVLGQPNHRIALLQVSAAEPEPIWGLIVSFLGAGIYEEALFRLLIFAGLVRLFSWTEMRTAFNVALAAFASALLFAGAHHLGPNGDAFNIYVLAFRTFAGVYFAAIYYARGFGIAVGAHAGYDVLVGLILQVPA